MLLVNIDKLTHASPEGDESRVVTGRTQARTALLGSGDDKIEHDQRKRLPRHQLNGAEAHLDDGGANPPRDPSPSGGGKLVHSSGSSDAGSTPEYGPGG